MLGTWSDKFGPRNRKPIAVLVTEDGNVHQFYGRTIFRVCSVISTKYFEQGIEEYQVYDFIYMPSTVFLSWYEDLETGLAFPQTSWDSGFAWMAKQAPKVTVAGFKSFINQCFQFTAKRWDA